MSKLPAPLVALFLLAAGIIIGLAIAGRLPWGDGRTVHVHAEGVADWLYQDTHNEDDGGLELEKFGTPQAPKGEDMIPLANRTVNAAGTRYTGLVDGQVFSLDRTKVTGSIDVSATDLTPLDATTSWDRAQFGASFMGPGGEHFKVVLTRLASPDLMFQTFGGVAFDHLVHGDTGLGTNLISQVFAYDLVQGFADTYKDGKLIATGNYVYTATTQAADALNEEKKTEHYDPAHPLGPLVVHLVVLPYNEKHDYTPIPTGVIGPDGKEQVFFHVNFMENIKVTGNRFFNAK